MTDFEGVRTLGRKVIAPKDAVWGHVPPENSVLNLGSRKPFSAFSAENINFQ